MAVPADPPTGVAALRAALARRPVLLDGGLATELERAGHDLTGRSWSGRLLRDAPDAVRAVHTAYLAAGAEVLTTASYQASFDTLAADGIDRADAEALLARSVTLAREAIAGPAGERHPGPRWVAASIGPYGATLPGGQEYRGDYADPRRPGALDVRALAAWHRPRFEVLAGSGADVVAVETLPAAAEAEALAGLAAELDVPVWLALTTVTSADGAVRTRLGEDVGALAARLGAVRQVVAIGVNCTDPATAAATVRVVTRAVAEGGTAVVAYPNRGETWDARRRSWTGAGTDPASSVIACADAGAALVGGCCRVGPGDVARLRDALDRRRAPTAGHP